MQGTAGARTRPHLSSVSVRSWWLRPAAPVLVISGIQLALHLSLNGAYGLHTDELYYVISGRHPALGYVDYPPVTPLLARLDTTLFGISPWTLRLFPAITGAAMVFLTGLCARELGGGRGAAVLASVVALLSPYLLATWLFQTVEFDEVLWLAAIYLVVRILRRGDPRLFLLLGLDLGIGFETKFTILALWAGVAAAVLLSGDMRAHLGTRYPWIGGLIALALAAPNAGWQIANGFPTLTYVVNHGSDIAQGGGALAFLELFVLVIGPVFLPLWLAGFVLLLRDPKLRPLAVLVAITILLFLPEGKAYYPAPAVPFVLAAGCVAVDRIVRSQRRRLAAGALIAAGLVEAAVLSPIILPLVPPAEMHSSGIDRLNPDFANTVGWPEMTAQVGAVYNALPSDQRTHAAILTSIDGQAGAIDVYGGEEGLPQAISPHLSFWYWKPAGLEPTTLVTVGYAPSDLAFLCGTVRQAGVVRVQYSIDNLNQGAPILVCTNLREPLGSAWPRLRNFS
jgi:4-amino-4-deoxy-L-arabinose transferase-like glycosyltransferase